MNIKPAKTSALQQQRFKLMQEAVERSKNHVGAEFVVIIAGYKSGNRMDIIDVGTSPCSVIDLYSSMVDAHLAALEADPDFTGSVQ